jgi:HTH-type transcriptional regulator, competence development regulator
MKTLGSSLKEARELNSLTLRMVEVTTGISNAYLSQLENDKIKSPSANILYKLANLYNLELNSLLLNSGIIKPNANLNKDASSEWTNRIAYYTDNMSEEQQQKVIEYLKFIKSIS